VAAPVIATVGAEATSLAPTLAVTIPAATVAGDLLIGLFASRHSGTVTSPSGWTVLDAPVGDGYYSNAVSHLVVCRRAAQAGDGGTTATWTADGGVNKNNCGIILRITGHDSTTPINVQAELNSPASTSQSWPTVTTTVDDCLILYPGGYDTATVSQTPDAAVTEHCDFQQSASDNAQRLVGSSETKATAGTTTSRTSTMSASTAVRKVTIAIAPGGAGQSAAVGTATETDTALALNRAKTRAVGIAAETDSALAVAAAKTRIVGVAAETDTGLPIGRVKTRAIGTASESDSALQLGRIHARALGIAAETDSALLIAGALAAVVRGSMTPAAAYAPTAAAGDSAAPAMSHATSTAPTMAGV